MKIKAISLASFATLALLSGNAFASGSWTNVTVVSVTVCTSEGCPPVGWVTVGLSAGAGGTPPTCSSGERGYVTINVTTAAGQLAANQMLSALQSGRPIGSILGTGACSVNPQIETLAAISS